MLRLAVRDQLAERGTKRLYIRRLRRPTPYGHNRHRSSSIEDTEFATVSSWALGRNCAFAVPCGAARQFGRDGRAGNNSPTPRAAHPRCLATVRGSPKWGNTLLSAKKA